jgi:phage baseplate assembly protein W
MIEIVGLTSEDEEIRRNIDVILSTPAGTVPFDREFGINSNFVDMPLSKSRALLTAEYIRKIRMYEPRAKVDQVNIDSTVDGQMSVKVVVSRV